MGSRYFELYDDVYIPGRWHVNSPVDAQGETIRSKLLLSGKPLELEGEPFIPVSHPGLALDFSLTELATNVVSHRFVSLCERLGLRDEVQFIRARVEGHVEPYFVLNALRVIRCIDDARCREVKYWEPEDGIPEAVGEYKDVAGLKIDPTQVGDTHLFRPWGWPVVLLVSEHLKQAIEEAGLTGPKFLEV